MKNSFCELLDSSLPEVIYWDTSFVINVLFKNQPYHKESVEFIKRLESTQPVVAVSEFIRPELWCATISVCIRNAYGKGTKPHDKIKLNPFLVRHYHHFAPKIYKDFLDLLQRFTHRLIIPLDSNVLDLSLQMMGKFSLGSYDAIHMATMIDWKIKDIVCFDWGMENTPYLHKAFNIWTVDGYKRFQGRMKRIGMKV